MAILGAIAVVNKFVVHYAKLNQQTRKNDGQVARVLIRVKRIEVNLIITGLLTNENVTNITKVTGNMNMNTKFL